MSVSLLSRARLPFPVVAAFRPLTARQNLPLPHSSSGNLAACRLGSGLVSHWGSVQNGAAAIVQQPRRLSITRSLEAGGGGEGPWVELSEEKNVQKLSNRERKELRSIAAQLQRDGKLRVHQIGKAGLSATSLTSLEDVLAANELIKVKIGGNSPYELEEAIQIIEDKAGATMVSFIGGTSLIYKRRASKSTLAPLVEEAIENRKPSPPREFSRLE